MLPVVTFQSLVVFPTLTWIARNKKFSRRNRFFFTLFATFCFALGQYLVLASEWEPNLFEVLGVGNSATQREIKAAFRKLSMDAHPDRGGSEEAFLKISKAHTVLSNDELREAYNRWGAMGLEWMETNQNLYLNGGIALAINVFIHFIMVFIMTVSVVDTNARSYGYAVLGFFTVLAVELRFGQNDPFELLWSTKTRDQKCAALFSVLSTVLVCLTVLQRARFKDFQLEVRARLERVELQQALLMAKLIPKREDGQEEEQPIRVGKINLAPPAGNPLLNLPNWVYILAFMSISSYFNA